MIFTLFVGALSFASSQYLVAFDGTAGGGGSCDGCTLNSKGTGRCITCENGGTVCITDGMANTRPKCDK